MLEHDDGSFARFKIGDQLAKLHAGRSRTGAAPALELFKELAQPTPAAADPEAAVDADPGEPGLDRGNVAKLPHASTGGEIRVMDDIFGGGRPDERRRDPDQSRARPDERRVEIGV